MRRLFKWKRLRWLAIGTVVRFVVRRSTARSVDQVTADIEERLPAPARKLMQVVPDSAVRAGGSAVVMGRTARRVATGTRRATQVAGDRRDRISQGIQRIRHIGDEVAIEAEQRRRELKADYLRSTEGHGPADDALLDLRYQRSGSDPAIIDDRDRPGSARGSMDDELPTLADPVRPGRWRADRALGEGLVGRVQRTYRPRSKPWDR